MTICSFSFHDTYRDWKLNEVSFSDFNLLVGQSGVGKTQILSALWSVRQAGIAGTQQVNGCKWELEIVVADKKYQWIAETALVKIGDLILPDEGEPKNGQFRVDSPRFLRETIIDEKGDEIVNRGEMFRFAGRTLPKLKNTESAISLLQNEEGIAPLYQSLSRFIASELPVLALSRLGQLETAERLREQYQRLEDLRDTTGIPILVKAYILQKNFPALFREIKDDFIEIFPTVSDVSLDERGKLSPDPLGSAVFSFSLAFGIKEKGVRGWVVNQHISAGMLRTFIHLVEIALASPEAVILIDELENSLGVNCLQQLTHRFLRRSELQFILTSHHPYIINNIPMKYWKLVTRKGSVVTVKDANSIKGLDPDSLLSGFVQLTNLEEYEEAIQ